MTFTLLYLLSFLFHFPRTSRLSSFISRSPTRPVDCAETSRSPFFATLKSNDVSPPHNPGLGEKKKKRTENEDARRILLTTQKTKYLTRKWSPSQTIQLLDKTTQRFLRDFSLIHSRLLLFISTLFVAFVPLYFSLLSSHLHIYS